MGEDNELSCGRSTRSRRANSISQSALTKKGLGGLGEDVRRSERKNCQRKSNSIFHNMKHYLCVCVSKEERSERENVVKLSKWK